MEKRPELNKNISIQDFKEFYWLKEELVAFCRQEQIKRSGSKIELTNRIEYYLKTGREPIEHKTIKRATSNFDWKTATLDPATIITDNYKNTENVRRFFSSQIGKSFKFNVPFMNWMKSNVGKTLQEAVVVWHSQQQIKKARTQPKKIAPQFEYNRYLRDFLADNPDKDRALGIKLWKIKKSMRGDNVYQSTDLKLLKQ